GAVISYFDTDLSKPVLEAYLRDEVGSSSVVAQDNSWLQLVDSRNIWGFIDDGNSRGNFYFLPYDGLAANEAARIAETRKSIHTQGKLKKGTIISYYNVDSQSFVIEYFIGDNPVQ